MGGPAAGKVFPVFWRGMQKVERWELAVFARRIAQMVLSSWSAFQRATALRSLGRLVTSTLWELPTYAPLARLYARQIDPTMMQICPACQGVTLMQF